MTLRGSLRLAVLFACCFATTIYSAQEPSSIGPKCARQLDRALEQSRTDAAALPPDTKPHYRLATIQFRPNDTAGYYALYLGKQSPAYQGNDVSELVKHLNSIAPLPPGGSYYIAFDGFEAHRSENLVNSLRLQLDSGDRAMFVEPILGDLDEWGGVTLRHVVDVEGEPEIHALADRPGWFEGTQTVLQQFSDRVRKAKLRVQSKSRSLIQSFFSLFNDKVAESKVPRTLVDLVSSTKAELKRTLNLNDTEFHTMVLDQTNRTFIVGLILRHYAG